MQLPCSSGPVDFQGPETLLSPRARTLRGRWNFGLAGSNKSTILSWFCLTWMNFWPDSMEFMTPLQRIFQLNMVTWSCTLPASFKLQPASLPQASWMIQIRPQIPSHEDLKEAQLIVAFGKAGDKLNLKIQCRHPTLVFGYPAAECWGYWWKRREREREESQVMVSLGFGVWESFVSVFCTKEKRYEGIFISQASGHKQAAE